LPERILAAQKWSRPLPEALVIPGVMTLTTLADVRKLLEHLPKEFREKGTFQHVASCLAKAARGGNAVKVSLTLRMVLTIEGIPCRPK
jgi:hypothetical protein